MRVRALVDEEDITKGKTYKVVEECNQGVRVVDNAGWRWLLLDREFEVVEEESMEEYKRGQKVLVRENGLIKIILKN